MKKVNVKVFACLMAGALMMNSCIGSFSLFNKYAEWQRTMTNSKFLNAIVGFILMPIVGSITLVIDWFVLNTIEFWSGDNPMAKNAGHCECTAMGRKYLGEQFDIHGGGMDLVFPHHECEIAQAVGAMGHQAVKYWMHNNMITINGQKMGKSLGNFITLEQFFTGKHELLSQPYSPMTIRFFILSAHYRSTVDFSDEALQA